MAASGEEELARLDERLRAAGIPHSTIRENEGPYAGQLTAIGIAPGPKEVFRRLLSSLPLLR